MSAGPDASTIAADAQLALQEALYTSRNPTRRYLHCARRAWVLDAIARQPSGGRALEIGPGSGVYLRALAQKADDLLVLDRYPPFLAAARTRLAQVEAGQGRVTLLQADLAAPPLAPASVELLLCSEVIEHLRESAQPLRAMAALLSPRGRLILTTPSPASPLELLGRIAFAPGLIHILRWIYREPVEATGHINLVSRRRLQREFAAAGLRVVESEVLGLYLPVIAEFGGAVGQRFLAWLERRLRASPGRALLWTQCYVLARQDPQAASGDSP